MSKRAVEFLYDISSDGSHNLFDDIPMELFGSLFDDEFTQRSKVARREVSSAGTSVCIGDSWCDGCPSWPGCESPVQGVCSAFSVDENVGSMGTSSDGGIRLLGSPSPVFGGSGPEFAAAEDVDSGRIASVPATVVETAVSGNDTVEPGIIGDDVPDAVPGNFRLQGKVFHLTYRGHIPFELVLAVFGGRNQCLYWSVVHEFGKHEGETGDAYAHTHVYVHLLKRMSKRGAGCCDVQWGGESVHPHIKVVRSIEHEGEIFWKYHRKDGGSALWQSEKAPKNPTLSSGNGSTLRSLIYTGSLLEAALACGAEIKSVSDINLIRNERVPVAAAISNYAYEEFNFQLNWMHFWPGQGIHETCCLYVYGPAGVGKTELAIAFFCQKEGKGPLLVRSMDQARDFHPERYVGIVFDDSNISHYSAEQRIHLVDYKYDSTIACRYKDGVVPAGTKRIFTSNKTPEEYWRTGTMMTDAQWDAVKRRVKFVHVANSLFA